MLLNTSYETSREKDRDNTTAKVPEEEERGEKWELRSKKPRRRHKPKATN